MLHKVLIGKLLLLTVLLPSSSTPAFCQAGEPETLLRRAKLHLFDEEWNEAIEALQKLQSEYPSSPLVSQAVFYEARALERLARRSDSVRRYEAFLALPGKPPALVKEARYSLVRLGAELFQNGDRSYLGRIIKALDSDDPDLQLYAAIQLSYLDDRKIQMQAVTRLKYIKEHTSDEESRNQATLALLRIDPRLLRSTPKPSPAPAGKRFPSLKLLITEDGVETIRLSLPLSLARMVFSALPDEVQARLEDKGLNPENLLNELEKSGTSMEFVSESETVKIWIE